ncbi:MAG: hypothetical protein MUE30_12430 [Spirosomaceae bacterium]|nr:hypothetical protein [Spirosomataceae bacterium]
MNTLFFWRHWTRPERFLYTTSLGLLAFGVLALLFFEQRGLQNSVQWDVLSELDEVAVRTDSMRVQKDSVQTAATSPAQTQYLLGKSYLLREQFVPSLMTIPVWLIDGVLGLILVGIVLILSAVSALSRWQYVGAMAAFMATLAFSHVELLQIFGTTNPTGVGIILGVLGLTSYYIHAFRPDFSMPQRIFIFAGLVVALTLLFTFFSKNAFPAHTFLAHSLLPALVIAVVFVGWIAVEIIAGFVYVVTNPRTGFGKNSLLNFLFLSGLYLSMLVLLYLKITRRTDAAFWYISPYWLYAASVVLGVWGAMRRLENHLPFRAIGAWLYVGVALVSTAVMAFVHFSSNNPHIEVFEDAIVYGQLGIGAAFTIYIALNFWPLFQQGKAVYKVIFKPMRLLQSQMWLVGVAAVVVLMSLNRFFTIDQVQAGHHNNLGDLSAATGEYKIAEQYYQMAVSEDYQNHKSGFGLASLALQQGDRSAAGAFFRQALYKDPTPQAYAGLARMMQDAGLFFDVIFTLRQAIETFPKSGELQNNLGALYATTNVADSTFYYFKLASQNAQNKAVTSANLLAFAAQSSLTATDLDDASLLNPSDYPSQEANRIALMQKMNTKTDAQRLSIKFPADSALSVNYFAYLYNYAQYARDTTLSDLLQRLGNTGNNGTFYNELQVAQAYAEYGRDKISALDVLAAQTVADTSKKTELARQTLLFWLTRESLSPANISTLTTAADYQNALRQHPLDVALLKKYVAFFNQQKQPQVAYQALLNAQRFRRDAPEIQKLYILQCLDMRLTEFATDGLNDLFSITNAADYEAFVKIYEARLAAIRQAQADF